MTQTLPLVSFEQAKLLKDAGFDWPTQDYITPSLSKRVGSVQSAANHNAFDGTYSVPTIAIAFKWLREVKGWHVAINPSLDWSRWHVTIYNNKEKCWQKMFRAFSSYDLAESAALTNVFKLNEE